MSTKYKGSILWVDDEIHHLKPHILYLKQKGYEVTKATNGHDAEVLTKKNRFDLILLDQTMPGIDGIETLKRVKQLKSLTPVVMITKSEDESLLEDAISGQIEQFLIKPINPKQVFIVCKQIIEKDKIIENKTSSDYLKEFQEINDSIERSFTINDWWNLFFRLSKWQLVFDSHKDSDLKHILQEQIQTCNRSFSNFIEINYKNIINSNNAEILSPNIGSKFLIPKLKQNKKVCMIIIDCMRCDQFLAVIPYLETLFNITISYHLSLIPSVTSFSRNAIFSGLYPDELINRYPEQKELFMSSESGLNKYEFKFLLDQLNRNGLKDKKVHYHKIWAHEEGVSFRKKLENYLNNDVLALVVNFVDMLAHDSSKINVLKEIVPDESGYRSAVKSWVKNSWFSDVLEALSNSDFEVIVTSDHGSTMVNKDILVSADRDASSGIRYKYGRNISTKNKNAFLINEPREYKLPILGPQFNYIIAKENSYFIYPNQANKYRHKINNSFQHGGVSMEELLIPVLTMNGE